jgi:hypothetical protein
MRGRKLLLMMRFDEIISIEFDLPKLKFYRRAGLEA